MTRSRLGTAASGGCRARWTHGLRLEKMDAELLYDVFLSHSTKDKTVVRPLAERLRADGLRVWFDEWEIRPGDSIPAKIEDGLEHSHVLVFCMSANAFGSDWAQLESQTFRFRDPLNRERHLIPLRLDDTPAKGSLAQLSYIDWRAQNCEQEYIRVLEACRPPVVRTTPETQVVPRKAAEEAIKLDSKRSLGLHCLAFSTDGRFALSGGEDNIVRLWSVEKGLCLRTFEGHTGWVDGVTWSHDQAHALSGSHDQTVRLWDLQTGNCLRIFEGHASAVWKVVCSDDSRRILSAGHDQSIRLWDMEEGRCLRVLEGHVGGIGALAWSDGPNRALSGGSDRTIRLWDVQRGVDILTFSGHTDGVWCVAPSATYHRVLSSSGDHTVRLWDLDTGSCLRILNGHSDGVTRVIWSKNERYAVSGSHDRTVRFWDVDSGRCLLLLEGHAKSILSIAWCKDSHRLLSGDSGGGIRIWDLSSHINDLRRERTQRRD